MVISWNTKKVNDGYKFNIVSINYNEPVKIIRSGFAITRTQAIYRAKKLARYYKTIS